MGENRPVDTLELEKRQELLVVEPVDNHKWLGKNHGKMVGQDVRFWDMRMKRSAKENKACKKAVCKHASGSSGGKNQKRDVGQVFLLLLFGIARQHRGKQVAVHKLDQNQVGQAFYHGGKCVCGEALEKHAIEH